MRQSVFELSYYLYTISHLFVQNHAMTSLTPLPMTKESPSLPLWLQIQESRPGWEFVPNLIGNPRVVFHREKIPTASDGWQQVVEGSKRCWWMQMDQYLMEKRVRCSGECLVSDSSDAFFFYFLDKKHWKKWNKGPKHVELEVITIVMLGELERANNGCLASRQIGDGRWQVGGSW